MFMKFISIDCRIYEAYKIFTVVAYPAW